MSKNDSLKNIIAKRYAGLKKDNPVTENEVNNDEVLDRKEKAEQNVDSLPHIENKPEPKKEVEKTVSYLPHRIGNKYFLIKIQYSLDIESDYVSQSDIEIVGVVPLAQKIIALQYEQTQAKSLKYYYDSQKNKELK